MGSGMAVLASHILLPRRALIYCGKAHAASFSEGVTRRDKWPRTSSESEFQKSVCSLGTFGSSTSTECRSSIDVRQHAQNLSSLLVFFRTSSGFHRPGSA